jgi:hypothetical protein
MQVNVFKKSVFLAIKVHLAGLAIVVSSGLIWDYQTRTGFRKNLPYNPREGLTRLRNLLFSGPLAAKLPKIPLSELALKNGSGPDKEIYFSVAGVVYDVTASELFLSEGRLKYDIIGLENNNNNVISFIILN